MSDVEVHIDLQGQVRRLGLLRQQLSRRGDTVTFEYDAGWLECANKFSIEPALTLAAGTFAPQAGQSIFGSIGDSAPDTWGRRLMQRAERRLAQREGRRVRTLGELHYLLTRCGRRIPARCATVSLVW